MTARKPAHLTDLGWRELKVARLELPRFEYRWACSCGRIGDWKPRARSARNGGARHVAAMEKK